MSLDVSLTKPVPTEVFHANITHNLAQMAIEAGIYMQLWRPDDLGIKKAGELIDVLLLGLAVLKSEPERFKKFEPENGWGTYDQFVEWVERYVAACEANPDADVSVDR